MAVLAASTDAERKALQQLVNQNENLRLWSDWLIDANRNLRLANYYTSATALDNDALFQNTAVRLKVEQNQLVDVFGEIGVGVDGLKGA